MLVTRIAAFAAGALSLAACTVATTAPAPQPVVVQQPSPTYVAPGQAVVTQPGTVVVRPVN